eukprot:356283-Chlamydomonas_euryale.AAC.2
MATLEWPARPSASWPGTWANLRAADLAWCAGVRPEWRDPAALPGAAESAGHGAAPGEPRLRTPHLTHRFLERRGVVYLAPPAVEALPDTSNGQGSAGHLEPTARRECAAGHVVSRGRVRTDGQTAGDDVVWPGSRGRRRMARQQGTQCVAMPEAQQRRTKRPCFGEPHSSHLGGRLIAASEVRAQSSEAELAAAQ